jgi:hypothetical protein
MLVEIDAKGPGDDSPATVTATKDHPFWVADLQEWRAVGEPKVGQWLRTSVGAWAQVTALRSRTQKSTVYNLTVDIDHTYYVMAGDTSILVHNDECGLVLQDLGNGKFESPEHLIYEPGSKQKHRILHVLAHAFPDPTKKNGHGVWDLGSQGILEAIDEAWRLRGTSSLTPKIEGTSTFYLVPMNRQVGTKGERHILIMVADGNRLITAYPKLKVGWEPDGKL